MTKIDLERDSALQIPDICNGKDKKMLYVGGSISRVYLYDEFKELGYDIEVVEIWPKNIEHLKKIGYRVIEGDIQDIDKLTTNEYDIILWWHGPEHIKKENLKITLEKLEKMSKLVVLGCPLNDLVGQKEVDGNMYERHLWIVQENDLNILGYSTKIVERNYHCNHITAWKFKTNL